jgi:outer membrane lipase/esterase
MFTLFREVVANPAAYGITTIGTVACLTSTSGQCTPATTVPNAAETLDLFAGGGYMPYKIDSSEQLNGVDTKNKDVTIGADYQLSQTGGAGIAVSYTSANGNFGNQTGSFRSKLTSLGIYGRAGFGHAYAFADGSYGWTSVDDIRRDVHINTAVRSESGSTSGNAAEFKIGGGYERSIGPLAIGPVASLNYDHIKLDGYTEKESSSTQLTFGSQSFSQITGSVGLQARPTGDITTFVPFARATFDYDITYRARTVSIMTLGAVTPFQGSAFLPARHGVSITGGAIARLAKNVSATVNANGIVGQSHITSYGVSTTLAVRF